MEQPPLSTYSVSLLICENGLTKASGFPVGRRQLVPLFRLRGVGLSLVIPALSGFRSSHQFMGSC
jgi:hypothetical protein